MRLGRERHSPRASEAGNGIGAAAADDAATSRHKRDKQSAAAAHLNAGRILLLKTSGHSVGSAGDTVLHLLPAAIQLNPGVAKDSIGGVNFAVVMQGRAAVPGHNNDVVPKGN